MESESSSSSSMRRVLLDGRQPVPKTGVARKAKGSIPSPSSKFVRRDCNWQTYSAQTRVDGGSSPPAGTKCPRGAIGRRGRFKPALLEVRSLSRVPSFKCFGSSVGRASR